MHYKIFINLDPVEPQRVPRDATAQRDHVRAEPRRSGGPQGPGKGPNNRI